MARGKKNTGTKNTGQKKEAKLSHVMITQDFIIGHWHWTDQNEIQAIQVKDVYKIGEIMVTKLEAAGMNVEEMYGIRHDKDMHETWDDKKQQMIIDYKSNHGHWVVRFVKGTGKTLPEIALAVGLEPQFLAKPKSGRYSYDNMVSYLTHIKYDEEDKHNYDPHEVVTIRGRNYLSYHMENLDSWMKAKATMRVKKAKVDIDWLEIEILEGRIGEAQLFLTDEYYEIYSHNKRRCDDALDTYARRKTYKTIQKMMNGDFRPTVYFITGCSHVGKSIFTDCLVKFIQDEAKKHGEDWTVCSTCATNPFDEYMGDEIIIMDDLRGASLTAPDWLKLLDPDRPATVSARYHNKKVAARVIIINSAVNVVEFFYFMKGGNKESMDQFIRRILCKVVVYRIPDHDFRRVDITYMKETKSYKYPVFDEQGRYVESLKLNHDFFNENNTRNMDYVDAVKYLTVLTGMNNKWNNGSELLTIGYTEKKSLLDSSHPRLITEVYNIENEIKRLRSLASNKQEDKDKLDSLESKLNELKAEIDERQFLLDSCYADEVFDEDEIFDDDTEDDDTDYKGFGLDLVPIGSSD